MKNYLFLLALTIFAFGAKAQTTGNDAKAQAKQNAFQMPQMFTLPDGKVIPSTKLDSVLKAWGAKSFSMGHDDAHPSVTYIYPTDTAFMKKLAEAAIRTKALLNQPAKNFDLVDLNGKHYSLDQLKGKVVVLNFWFTNCIPCIQEMPQLNQILKKYNSSKVVFLALARDDKQSVSSFSKKHEFDYTLLTDAVKVADAYNIGSYPTSMVIDQKGIIRFIQISGEKIGETLPAAINAML